MAVAAQRPQEPFFGPIWPLSSFFRSILAEITCNTPKSNPEVKGVLGLNHPIWSIMRELCEHDCLTG
eukprot:1194336-Prorocentrum_minimum.AAC.6